MPLTIFWMEPEKAKPINISVGYNIQQAIKLAKISLEQEIASEKIRLGRILVKIPKLNAGKKGVPKKRESGIPLSALVNILVKSTVEKAKNERKAKQQEDKSYKIIRQDVPLIFNGGYGTVSRGYGIAPHKSYVDYEKLFSYLGKFKAQGASNNVESVEFLNNSAESGSFVLADKETMDKVGRFDKYVKNPAMAMQTLALSLVPIAGLSSAEWEDIKNLMMFDRVMYALKTKTS